MSSRMVISLIFALTSASKLFVVARFCCLLLPSPVEERSEEGSQGEDGDFCEDLVSSYSPIAKT
jgi:hypothetical protein